MWVKQCHKLNHPPVRKPFFGWWYICLPFPVMAGLFYHCFTHIGGLGKHTWVSVPSGSLDALQTTHHPVLRLHAHGLLHGRLFVVAGIACGHLTPQQNRSLCHLCPWLHRGLLPSGHEGCLRSGFPIGHRASVDRWQPTGPELVCRAFQHPFLVDRLRPGLFPSFQEGFQGQPSAGVRWTQFASHL